MSKYFQRKSIPRRALNNPLSSSNTIEETLQNDKYLAFPAGEAITLNDPIYITSGTAYIADTVPAMYIAGNDASIGDNVTCLSDYTDIELSNYIDVWNINGVISQTQPNEYNSNFQQRLGKMVSDTKLKIEVGTPCYY